MHRNYYINYITVVIIIIIILFLNIIGILNCFVNGWFLENAFNVVKILDGKEFQQQNVRSTTLLRSAGVETANTPKQVVHQIGIPEYSNAFQVLYGIVWMDQILYFTFIIIINFIRMQSEASIHFGFYRIFLWLFKEGIVVKRVKESVAPFRKKKSRRKWESSERWEQCSIEIHQKDFHGRGGGNEKR